jgi:uncharacterized Zn-finger protein
MRSGMRGFKPDEIDKNQKKVSENKFLQKMDPNSKVDRNSNDSQDDTFDLSKFQYYKPTFFALIEEKFNKYTQGSPEVKNTCPIYRSRHTANKK